MTLVLLVLFIDIIIIVIIVNLPWIRYKEQSEGASYSYSRFKHLSNRGTTMTQTDFATNTSYTEQLFRIILQEDADPRSISDNSNIRYIEDRGVSVGERRDHDVILVLWRSLASFILDQLVDNTREYHEIITRFLKEFLGGYIYAEGSDELENFDILNATGAYENTMTFGFEGNIIQQIIRISLGIESCVTDPAWWNAPEIDIIDAVKYYRRDVGYKYGESSDWLRNQFRDKSKPFVIQVLDIDSIIYNMYLPCKIILLVVYSYYHNS